MVGSEDHLMQSFILQTWYNFKFLNSIPKVMKRAKMKIVGCIIVVCWVCFLTRKRMLSAKFDLAIEAALLYLTNGNGLITCQGKHLSLIGTECLSSKCPDPEAESIRP